MLFEDGFDIQFHFNSLVGQDISLPSQMSGPGPATTSVLATMRHAALQSEIGDPGFQPMLEPDWLRPTDRFDHGRRPDWLELPSPVAFEDDFIWDRLPGSVGGGGGKDGFTLSTEPDSGVIVVTGKRNKTGGFDWYVHGTSGTGDVPVDNGDASIEPGGESMPLDEDVVEITIKINRPLTGSEKTALENLKATIAAIETAIRNLANNSILKLPNGADVTGAELKAIWAKLDFVITDNVTYPNGFGGEANMVDNVQPLISVNIQYLDGYDNSSGGINYVVAHEMGHLSQWLTPYVYDQLTANNIARALLNGASLEYLANPGHGYSEDAPMQFSVPTS